MPSSDKLIYAIADDINRYSRDKYERILVELDLYDLKQLHDVEEGYAKILLKKEFIRTTLEEKGIEVLIDALSENGMLSPKTIKLLQEDGYELFDEQKTDTSEQENLSDAPSKKTAAGQTKASSKTEGTSNNSPKKSGVKKRTGISTAIIVAIIGCAGTVIAALLIALIGYFDNKSQVEIPIRATQTAEALQKYQTANAPTEVSSTATPNIDWSTILKGSSYFNSPCGIKVVPEYVTLDPKNMQLSWANFNDEFSKQGGRDWDSGFSSVLNFDLESYSQLNWVKVENRFIVNVLVESEIPANPNIVFINGCGGGSSRMLEKIELINQTNMREYRVSLSYPDMDFFTLQPGEFESFWFPLDCQAPGIYSFTIEVYAEYFDESGSFKIVPSARMYCPYSFNKYISRGGGENLEYVGKIEWNGNEYQEIP